MKRIAAAILMICMVLSFAACSGGAKKTVNEAYSAENMVTVSGEEHKLSAEENTIGDSTFGYLFPEPAAWGNVKLTENTDLYYDEYGVVLNYVPSVYSDKIDALMKETDDTKWQTAYDELISMSCRIFSLMRVNDGEADTLEIKKNAEKDYAHMETLAQVGNDTYYLAWNDTFDIDTMTDADRDDVKTLSMGMEEMKKSLMVFPPVKDGGASSGDSGTSGTSGGDMDFDFKGDLGKLDARDVDGNAVTSAIFADYDVTMVNIWDTGCGACVSEMPELGKLKGMLPAKANMITICLDGASDTELTKQILATTGASITTVAGDNSLNDTIGKYIDAVPTTIFVDSSGKTLGGMIGVPSSAGGAAEGYLAYIQKLLDKAAK
mgnify:CR=1 FL=1